MSYDRASSVPEGLSIVQVALCDKSGGGRAKTCVASLVEAGADVFLVDGSGVHRAPSLSGDEYLPDRVSLLLIHSRDWELWNTHNGEQDLIIRYSGGGPPDGAPEDELWIQRPINSEDEGISVDEAKEILEWLRCKQNADEECELPRILRRWQSSPILHALMILCQGYLAVHGDVKRRVPDLPPEEEECRKVVSQAQQKMGWYDVDIETLDLRMRDPKLRRELQVEVRQTSWWRAAFEKIDLAGKVQRELEIDEEPMAPLKVLMDLLDPGGSSQKKGTLVPPKVVAECFLALLKRLDGSRV